MLTPRPEHGDYVIDEDEVVLTVDHDDGTMTTVTLLRGDASDGASIPRFFWRVVGSPFDPELMPGALMHDKAYRSASLTRRQADEAFHDRMRADGVGRVRAWVIWFAVRCFGWLFYRRCAADRCREH